MNKIKVLLIEDDRSISNFITATMDREGYKIMHALNGREGLSLSTSFCPNVILLDLGLPDMDGLDVLQKLRSWSDVPVIIISARTKEQEKVSALDLGADDYITKPFSPSEMVARVKAHLARYERLIGSGMPENEIIEIRGLKIDKTARRVYINGEEKNFTTKEFDLLTFLAQNPNHVFTKEELFREIWDMESLGDIATVTVHIKKIREKIEFNTAKPQYIETIWGVGYRFKV